MGNYPYPSHYMGGSAEHPLPAWPMRAACQHLSAEGLQGHLLLQVRIASPFDGCLSRSPALQRLTAPALYMHMYMYMRLAAPALYLHASQKV